MAISAGPLPLGHDGESVVVLNDCLDVLNDMLFDDAELPRVVSDPLVLVLRQRDNGSALLVSALADDVHERDVWSGSVGRPDHLVDLPDDGLVLGNAFLPKAHSPAPAHLQGFQPSDTRSRLLKHALAQERPIRRLDFCVHLEPRAFPIG